MGGAPQHRLFHSVVLGVRVLADQAKSANTQQQEYIIRLTVLFESDPAADETRDTDIKSTNQLVMLPVLPQVKLRGGFPYSLEDCVEYMMTRYF